MENTQKCLSRNACRHFVSTFMLQVCNPTQIHSENSNRAHIIFSDDDQDLWDDDPHEYIRSKFDVFEDFISPNTGMTQLL